MSLIDDARRLSDASIGQHCDFCTGSPISGHFEGCPMLSMPGIVAALEAMHAILDDPEVQDCSDRCVEFVRRTLVDALTE